MNDSARVSIITPTFNRRRYIPIAVESVLAQTYPNWQLIVVDDGSTDDTAEIMARYSSDGRIEYVQQPRNLGQAAARNVGLSRSRGDFVCFLDSDNVWKPWKLEQQVDYLEAHPDIDIVYGEGERIDEDGNSLPSARVKRHSGMITLPLLYDNFVGFNTVMVRKAVFDKLGGFDESVRFGDDYDLWLRFSPHCRFEFRPGVVCQYRVMPNQISSNKEARFQSNRQMMERFFANNPDFDKWAIKASAWSRFHTRRGRYRTSTGAYARAAADFAAAVGYAPVSAAGWRGMARLLLTMLGKSRP